MLLLMKVWFTNTTIPVGRSIYFEIHATLISKSSSHNLRLLLAWKQHKCRSIFFSRNLVIETTHHI
jgi:hypothetical protein